MKVSHEHKEKTYKYYEMQNFEKAENTGCSQSLLKFSRFY